MDENVKIIVSAVDKASKQLEKIGKSGKTSFTELKSAVDLAAIAFTQVLRVGKQVFDLGREGAKLQYTADKFDNLSRSIGTTSDALKTDLKEATRGMISDAELVESATNLMALGLVRTHDEAVRLTRAAGALNMDMNQLVLTLTNQTTMRFDALGVSVAGFDEKVEALKKTGMSASDAFNEAFLQQAEAQIRLVGEVADSAEASFIKMDVAIDNMSDTVKLKAAPAVTDFANLIADMLSMKTESWFKDGADAAAKFLNNMFNTEQATREAYEALSVHAMRSRGYATAVGEASEATKTLASETAIAAGISGDFADVTAEVAKQLMFQKASADLDAKATRALAEAMGIWSQESFDVITGLEDIRAKLDAGRITSDQYTSSVKNFTAAWNALNSLGQVKDFMIRVALETSERVSAWGGETNPYAPKTTTTNNPKGPPKAAGGYVSSNTAYLVGERGPEMFVPNTGGNIVPNNALGGGDTYLSVTINALPGMDENAIVARMFSMLSRGNSRSRGGMGYAGI